MSTMTFDGLTATLLRQAGTEAGWTLSDFAASLHAAVAGTFDGIERGRRGAVGWAEFSTDRTVDAERVVRLMAPGWNAFMGMSAASPLTDIPMMWGGVIDVGGRFVLRLAGIRLHGPLVAIPHRGEGILLPGHHVPDIVRAAAVGRTLAELVSAPAMLGADLVVTGIRDARADDFEHLMRRRADGDDRGVVIGVETDPDTTVRFELT